MILAAGTASGAIRIWDIREGTNVANFLDHTANVVSLSFSENGYHLVSAARDNTIQVWDLRKLKTIKTITMPENYEVSHSEEITWTHPYTNSVVSPPLYFLTIVNCSY